MITEAHPSPRGTASYITAMLGELRTMSEKENFGVLTYLIEMALIEATDLAHGINMPSTTDVEREDASQAQSG
ncbi:MAG: hypothetical protein AAF468_08990 [Pseudomonadota bacterium]